VEISNIVPLFQEGEARHRQFEVEFDDGSLVYLWPDDLLSYRRAQRAILEQAGTIYTNEAAEKRGGMAAWQRFVRDKMGAEVTVPEHERYYVGTQREMDVYVWSIERWRRAHREKVDTWQAAS